MAENPAAVVETPETTVVVDEATLGEVISRLDQIISLLTPAPAAQQPGDAVRRVDLQPGGEEGRVCGREKRKHADERHRRAV